MIHRTRLIRRLALGGALAGVAIGLVPGVASAGTPRNPTCTFDEGTHQVSLFDKSDVFPLIISRDGIDIVAQNESSLVRLKCFSTTGSGLTANIFNTDKITVFGTPMNLETGGCSVCPPRNDGKTAEDDLYVIDESRGSFGPGFTPEADGQSEIEIVFETGGIATRLEVDGTPATASAVNDEIRIGGPLGFINFGSDNDIDVKLRAGAMKVAVAAGAGADLITGRGNFLDATVLPPTTVPLDVDGGAGNDTVIGGDAPDELGGGADDDFIRSNGGLVDVVGGGPGLNDRAIHDPGETLTGVEFPATNPLGVLQLKPGALHARAGKPAQLRMSWTHPKAWRALRSVMLQLYDNGRAVGMINVRPARERLTADGAIALAPGSRVEHVGKTVTARLALRLPRSLAGRTLRVAVEAIDRHGRKQLEPDAGSVRVTP